MTAKINYQRLSELSPGDTFTLLRDRDTYTLLRVVPAQKQVLHYWCKPRGNFGEVRLYATSYVVKHPHEPLPEEDPAEELEVDNSCPDCLGTGIGWPVDLPCSRCGGRGELKPERRWEPD